jgi:Bacterial inner membrane protein
MTVLTMLLALISAALDGPPDSRGVRLARALYLVALLPVAVLAAWSWAGWHSLFAALGTTVACCGRWQTDKRRFRALILACSVPWFAHNLAVGSVPAMVSDLFLMGRGAWLAWRDRAPLARMAASAA